MKVTVIKSIELDKYNEGCDPDTFMDLGTISEFHAVDLDGITRELGLRREYLYFFDGRIEFSRHETDLGDIPTELQTELWKRGLLDLYHANYSCYLTKEIAIDTNIFNLSEG
jgi:hypothetical protein